MKFKSDKTKKVIVYILCGFIALNIIFTIFSTIRNGGALSGTLSFFLGWALAATIGTMLFKENFRKLFVSILFVLACISAGFLIFFITSPSAFSLHTVSAQQAALQIILYGFLVIFYTSTAYFLSRPSTKKLFHSRTNQTDK